MSWLDRQFSDTPIIYVFLALICLPVPAFLLGLIGVIFCRDPLAREKAAYLVIIPLALIGGGAIFYFLFQVIGGGPVAPAP